MNDDPFPARNLNRLFLFESWQAISPYYFYFLEVNEYTSIDRFLIKLHKSKVSTKLRVTNWIHLCVNFRRGWANYLLNYIPIFDVSFCVAFEDYRRLLCSLFELNFPVPYRLFVIKKKKYLVDFCLHESRGETMSKSVSNHYRESNFRKVK